jgi:single-strand DNA-binding protein
MNNTIILIGRITKDIEIKETNSGKKVCEFTLAVNRDRKNENGEYDTDFITIRAWNNTADLLDKYTTKGDMLGVKGQLRVDSFVGKDGNNKYKTYVLCDSIQFLQPKEHKNTNKEESKTPNTDAFREFSEEIELSEDDLPF